MKMRDVIVVLVCCLCVSCTVPSDEHPETLSLSIAGERFREIWRSGDSHYHVGADHERRRVIGHPGVCCLATPQGSKLSPREAYGIYFFLLSRHPPFSPICLCSGGGNYLITGTNVVNEEDRGTYVLINGMDGSVWERFASGSGNWHPAGFVTNELSAVTNAFSRGADARPMFNVLGMPQATQDRTHYRYLTFNGKTIEFELYPDTWTIKHVYTGLWGFH